MSEETFTIEDLNKAIDELRAGRPYSSGISYGLKPVLLNELLRQRKLRTSPPPTRVVSRYVPSGSVEGQEHVVTTMSDGTSTCTCRGFSTHRHCKHQQFALPLGSQGGKWAPWRRVTKAEVARA